MANNRMYIGNKETGEYTIVAKSFGDWVAYPERFTKIIENQYDWVASHGGDGTNFVIFTENNHDRELFKYPLD